MKLFLIHAAICLAVSMSPPDQYLLHKKQLVDNELAFARLAANTSIKAAFDAYLAPRGILFRAGMPVNGLSLNARRTAVPAEKLRWYPEYALVTRSGDMGFTAGPYWYSLRDSVKGTGYFFSIWEKNEQQVYKLILDAGITHTVAALPSPVCEAAKIVLPVRAPVYVPAKDSTAERAFQQFCASAQIRPAEAYRQYISAAPLVVRANWPQLADSREAHRYFSSANATRCDFEVLGQGASIAREMQYYYGRAIIYHGKGKTEKGYFVQVWRPEAAGWKLVADVFEADRDR
ncbi:hypothetical protein FHW36_11112 [Chitinophaga polysaccharea]|uniref:DUF4440 domain-containing protein n=1 Tax=Chitinophaga polysaccharea TaxID=1293035 RepID=A0A561P6T9_9BACT|nr:hypothetical protein [Chitinophaga polysaccharea]TWF33822.1 hypothetical protein FHW36_11112 [Chitinophaga polysaccharea]